MHIAESPGTLGPILQMRKLSQYEMLSQWPRGSGWADSEPGCLCYVSQVRVKRHHVQEATVAAGGGTTPFTPTPST